LVCQSRRATSAPTAWHIFSPFPQRVPLPARSASILIEPGTCAPGASAASVCTDCVAGKHKASAGVYTACDNCEAAGKYSGWKAKTSPAACFDCGAGTYSLAGAALCTNCEPEVLRCEAAAASTRAGQRRRAPPPASTTVPARTRWLELRSAPTANPKYSEASAATVCTDCVAGKLSAAVGASAASACTDCGAGRYAPAGSSACSKCDAGSS
jgi:hypothetical protein